MSRRPIVLLLSLLALTGCFSEVPSRPGASEAELASDYRACQALAAQQAPRTFDPQTQAAEPDAYTVARDQRRCMEARGWHYAPVW